VLDRRTAVPTALRHPAFVATPLTTDLAPLDYAAYMASPDVINRHSDGRWQVAGFTLDDDVELIAQHQADHESNRAFTFSLLDPTESHALGCLYLNSLHGYLERVGAAAEVLTAIPTAAAMVTFWLRQDEQGSDLAEAVVGAVNDWLVDAWPLDSHLFRVLPGESSSRAALERNGLQRRELELPGERRPYLWYEPA
jgi:RimJ/RimL family protein N-acetyltransferase